MSRRTPIPLTRRTNKRILNCCIVSPSNAYIVILQDYNLRKFKSDKYRRSSSAIARVTISAKIMLNIRSTFNKWPSSTGVSKLFHLGWWQNLSALFALKNLPLKLTQFCTTLYTRVACIAIGIGHVVNGISSFAKTPDQTFTKSINIISH